MISSPINPNSKPYPYNTTIGFSLTALLIFLAIIYGKRSVGQQLIFADSPFQFHVYCPISSKEYLQQYVNLIRNAKVSQNGEINIQEDIYVVYIQARRKNATDNSTAGLYYCGLARTWLGSCEDAKIRCSSPGPMFYLQTKKPIYIIWINDIDTNGLNWAEEDCYSPDSSDQFCTVSSRLKASKSKDFGCAYKDPTDLHYQSSSVRIDRNHVPISPHIHGMQNRPIFDGNPLSWFDNAGDFGVGYYSLDNPEYFQQFLDVQSFYKMPFPLINKNIKINYVPNDQPAGNLFYHDHAMRSTKYNVKYGLGGLYILYDENIDSLLPQLDHEKFIVFSAKIDGDARSNLTEMPVNPHHSNRHNSRHGHQIIYTLNVTDVFERNSLYRFRILNSHFDNIYTGVSFSVYYTQTLNRYSKPTIKEIDPSNIAYNLSQHQHKINFTMIGADSTIFDKFIPGQDRFDLGAAERVEILFQFNEASGVPKGVNYFYLTCDDGNAGGSVVKYKFKLINSCDSYRDVQIPTGSINPYTDLSKVKTNKIVLKRMRPLLSLPRDEKFVINGHYMFDMGASENPKIGTVEDWYFVNTLFEAHPMHFHLVNFQVIQTFSLKMVQDQCTLYEVDYLRSSGYEKFQTFTDEELCDYIANNITSEEAEDVFHRYNSLYLENQAQNIPNLGKISGFNVLQPAESQNIVVDQGCSLGSIYKYICDETSVTIPKHYKRWKDTALIPPFAVSVLRVRWTMTEYNQKVKAYPYFKVPEDQLMEFPGFVYHCHILPHEDNEMMRPVMLQASDTYQKYIASALQTSRTDYNKSKLAYTWNDKYQKINQKLGCKSY